MRGYFGIGVEGISKPMNLGNLLRSAHAFGASFFFTIAPDVKAREVKLSDTSDAAKHMPLYRYNEVDELTLPKGCRLVGVELLDGAEALPSFHHPSAAAYVFGPERGSLSPELVARCDLWSRFRPSSASTSGVAGAIVMYDRTLAKGRFARRPVGSGSAAEAIPRTCSWSCHLARSLVPRYISCLPEFDDTKQQIGRHPCPESSAI